MDFACNVAGLPQTGGAGTVWFLAIGLVILIAALAIWRRKAMAGLVTGVLALGVIGLGLTTSPAAAAPNDSCTAAISGAAWWDTNGDGIHQDGEAVMTDATVRLLNPAGATLRTAHVNSEGAYAFTDLAASTYYVQFIAPSNTRFTLPLVGASETDSDALSTGRTNKITLADGERVTGIDVGFVSAEGSPTPSSTPSATGSPTPSTTPSATSSPTTTSASPSPTESSPSPENPPVDLTISAVVFPVVADPGVPYPLYIELCNVGEYTADPANGTIRVAFSINPPENSLFMLPAPGVPGAGFTNPLQTEPGRFTIDYDRPLAAGECVTTPRIDLMFEFSFVEPNAVLTASVVDGFPNEQNSANNSFSTTADVYGP